MKWFCYICLIVIPILEARRISSVQDIEELTSNKVNIRNERELVKKLNKLLKEGYNNLQIITDFDNTLTVDSGISGKPVLNTFEMLRKCPSVLQSYKDDEYKLFQAYMPIENDLSMSVEDKSRYMVEWYKSAHNLMKGMKYPRDEMEEIAKNITFRDGVEDLIDWSETNQVPIVVLSSGLGDALTAALQAKNFSSPYLKVLSNFLELNKDDMILGMKGNPIHSFNKNKASIKNTDFYDLIKTRSNILLMGDSIGDANMADGIDNSDTVIKVGFLSTKRRDKLPVYMEQFDIVLINDQTMNVVNAIINRLK